VTGGATGIDGFAQANAPASPLSPGTVTTTGPGAMLLLCAFAASYGSPDVYTPSAGYTLLDQQTNGTNSIAGGDAYHVAGAPGAYGGAMSSSLDYSGGAVFLVALRR